MSFDFDMLIIGAGPAGYVAAIRAAQLGFNTCLVEGRKNEGGKGASLGGTCLNVGCIPSKALLHSSEKYEDLHTLSAHGISISGAKVDVAALQTHKESVVAKLTGGISMLMQANKVTVKHGWAKVTGSNRVNVDGKEDVSAKHILIATGSVPVELPFAKFDHTHILDSTDALSLKKAPKSMVVIGAGVIGLEMGSVWRRLGTDVTLVDIADRPVAMMDAELGKMAQKAFEGQGLKFKLGAGVKDVKTSKTGVTLTLEKDGKEEKLRAETVLVSVGRKANTANMGLEEVGVAMDARGVVQVNEAYQTNIPSIYAVGDCIPGPMLAHKGEEEGIACVEALAGQKPHVNYNTIPWVVYTHPEIAGVGKTEEELKEAGTSYKKGKFNFAANGRALAVEAGEGFVKILAHAETDEVLGVHMIGMNVSELVAEVTLAMEYRASAEDIARTCHAHPTMSEATKEAALAVHKRAIHS